jgi:hypothetical protein
MRIINYIIIILASFLLAWIMPMLHHLAVDKASKNIFTYYSSVDKSFCTIDFDDVKERLERKNVKTNREYTAAEFDSILPLFYHRQLLADGRMPDSIHGVAISPKEINEKGFYFRYNPTDKNKPHIPIYTLFESMSGRVNLEMPGDMFRLKDRIEFLDPETNLVNQAKSDLFMRVFEKRGFKFPAKLAAGNPTTRKPYEEGYFIIDSSDKLFHLKMVNAKPFLKSIDLPSGLKPIFISTMEPYDRSFYAFVFDQNNKMYMLSTQNYDLVEIACPDFDMDFSKIVIMANMLYWNINVISSEGKSTLALDARSKVAVDQLDLKTEVAGKSFMSYFFPFTFRFQASNTKYIEPVIKVGQSLVFIINLIIALLYVGFKAYRKQKTDWLRVAWIALTGVFGLIPCLLFNK